MTREEHYRAAPDDREWRMVRLDDETVRGLSHESSIVRACSESAIRSAFANAAGGALPAEDTDAQMAERRVGARDAYQTVMFWCQRPVESAAYGMPEDVATALLAYRDQQVKAAKVRLEQITELLGRIVKWHSQPGNVVAEAYRIARGEASGG